MIHSISTILQIVAILGCISSCAYYVLCLAGSWALLRSWDTAGRTLPEEMPPVSILKPLKGTDPEMYESFRSHCLQDYPNYEIVFGVSDPSDPAVGSVDALKREFPQRSGRT
jgi:ceramide glucosyltransferase